MAKLPKFNISLLETELLTAPRVGNIVNNYVPFNNLVKNNSIGIFNTDKIQWDLNHPVEMEIQDSPDGSVNIILNDDKNTPMMINSRFSLEENSTYVIPDHFTNKDTNLYDENHLLTETSLVRITTKLPKLEFLGIDEGGAFPCGTYHFYFKLSDNDGNETDFIAESGVVTCHIGTINDPFSIRMGMENENSRKSVSFKISNLDTAYDFLIVYYTRITSGEEGSDLITYHKILNKFPITSDSQTLIITGKEPTQLTVDSEILESYYYVDHAKTSAVALNTLFLGNIQEPIINYEALKLFAWHIIPYEAEGENIGNLNYTYKDRKSHNINRKPDRYKNINNKFYKQNTHSYSYEYYNALNIYYNLGYWPEEYYRFGIVFIYNNYSLSPVFNVRGVDWTKTQEATIENNDIIYTDNGFINGNYVENIYGITKLSNDYSTLDTNKPRGVAFKLCIGNLTPLDSMSGYLDYVKKNIKGFFFVRQKRSPITLCLGYVGGKTTKYFGNLPCLQNNKGEYFTESFLSLKTSYMGNIRYNYNLLGKSYPTISNKNVECKLAYVPDAIIKEPLYNQIFLGQTFKTQPIKLSEIKSGLINQFYTQLQKNIDSKLLLDTKCLNIISGVKTKIIDDVYFSSLAGFAEDIYTFTSVLHDWDREGAGEVAVGQTPPNNFVGRNMKDCIPMQLKLDLLVRGVFGSYVGIVNKEKDYDYGTLINFKIADYEDTEDFAIKLILKRKFDYSPFYAISDRLELNNLLNTLEEKDDAIVCFRGDCYNCLFTHRIIRNHIDPEVPTNDKLVEPGSWDNNFLVITKTCIDDADSPTGKRFINDIVPLFKAKNLKNANGKSVKASESWQILKNIFAFTQITNLTDKEEIIKDLAEDSYDLRWSEDEDGLESLAIILPNDSKYSKVGNLGTLAGVPNTWYEYGKSNISRSDVNSVGLGHWLTMRVLSNYNLYMRDTDSYQLSEKIIFNKPRGFYPIYPLSTSSEYKLPESKLINGATNVTTSCKVHTLLPEMPYIKQQYDTRILYSNVYNGGWKNGFRVFKNNTYLDMPKTYGALVKLIELRGNLVGIMEHGILLIPIKERVVSGLGDGGSVYINTNIILPDNPHPISDMYGSTWLDSIIKTHSGIYGIDTFAKKIWFTDGLSLLILSDFKLQKFLNDNINLNEWDKFCELGFRNVKTHYNAFKNDIIFTFYNDDKYWNLCYNEYYKHFSTFYSWSASYSANINNVFISLDLNDTKNIYTKSGFGWQKSLFYKHFVNRIGLNIVKEIGEEINDYNSDLQKLIEDILKGKLGTICYILPQFNQNVIPDNFYPRLYDTISNNDNKYIILEKTNQDIGSILYPDQTITKIVPVILLRINPNYIEELKEKKYLNIRFLGEYYENYNENLDNNIISYIDLYLRLYNSEKCTNELWKHGLGGIFDGESPIKPTHWYGLQEPFSFEFIVSNANWVLHMYHNLLILSNNVKPEEIQFEVVGDSYDWWLYKDIINFVNNISANDLELKENYYKILTYTLAQLKDEIFKGLNFPTLKDKPINYTIKSIPYIRHIRKTSLGEEFNKFTDNTTEVILVEDDLLPEKHIRSIQKCNDIKLDGRIKGNIEYVEDSWWSEIRHMNFRIAYVQNNILKFKKLSQSKIRDRYMKVKISYSGKDLVIIRGISTLIEQSQC